MFFRKRKSKLPGESELIAKIEEFNIRLSNLDKNLYIFGDIRYSVRDVQAAAKQITEASKIHGSIRPEDYGLLTIFNERIDQFSDTVNFYGSIMDLFKSNHIGYVGVMEELLKKELTKH